MNINPYVKKWCDENYDVRKEEFYIENAYYVADREWAIGGFKHGLFSLLVAFITMVIGSGHGTSNDILNALVAIGISTVCFWFFGIRRYDANSVEISTGIYIALMIVLFVLKSKASTTTQIIFAIPTMCLYVYLAFIKPIRFMKTKAKMKQRIEEEEKEEEQNSKQNYTQWENSYKAFRYGIPEHTVHQGDTVMNEAKKLFDGYTDNKSMLKTRYRQLAKQYHPDHGGDTKLFQCIVEVYEEFNQSFV